MFKYLPIFLFTSLNFSGLFLLFDRHIFVAQLCIITMDLYSVRVREQAHQQLPVTIFKTNNNIKKARNFTRSAGVFILCDNQKKKTVGAK